MDCLGLWRRIREVSRADFDRTLILVSCRWLTYQCTGEKEAFWGVDHIGQVVEHLELPRKDEPGLRAML